MDPYPVPRPEPASPRLLTLLLGYGVLALILATYYGRLKLPIPGGLLAVLVGMALAWGSGLIHLDAAAWASQSSQVGLRWPHLELAALWEARGQLLPWLGVVLWGLAAGQWLLAQRPAPLTGSLAPALRPLAVLGRWSLSVYMVHQPVFIGLLMGGRALGAW